MLKSGFENIKNFIIFLHISKWNI